MSEKEAPQKDSVMKFLLFGMWALYALIAFCVNHEPGARAGSAQAPQAPQTTAAGSTAVGITVTGNAADQQSAMQPAAQVQRDIYLTFDDGPCENTLQVLDILDSFGAKATFFTVGCYVDRYPAYVQEIVRRGNLLACHTYTHDMAQCYASGEAFMNEVVQWRQSVTNACGILPDRICVRFPGGSTTKYAAAVSDDIKQRLTASGYRWFDWNAGDNDKWQKGNTDQLPDEEYYMQSYRECMKWFDDEPETPVVFLMHDTEIGTVNVLPSILNDLVNRGYCFRLLDSHPDWNM